jgi:mRNA-degrading endonuclease YafQ of YafQ-DinJ toxin-antitoxin module
MMSKLIVELSNELHASLKKQAAADGKTLKVIVTSLLDHYVQHPHPRARLRTTRLCGAWKDHRSAHVLAAELRTARRWWTRDRE